jgi:O-succinylbenzoate synthase
MAIELKSARFMNVKPGRVGGLTPAVQIHDACQAAQIPCWVGATPQSAIAARAGVALATKGNFSYPAEFISSDELLEQDLAEPPVPARDEAEGLLRVPLWMEPGIGVEPDAALLEKWCLSQAKV